MTVVKFLWSQVLSLHVWRGTGGPTMPAISDIIFDGGFAADKAETERLWYPSGWHHCPLIAPAYLDNNGKNIISKAWDNRYSVLMVSELWEPCQVKSSKWTLPWLERPKKGLVFVALILLQLKFDPEVFLAVDCSPAWWCLWWQRQDWGWNLDSFLTHGSLAPPGMKRFPFDNGWRSWYQVPILLWKRRNGHWSSSSWKMVVSHLQLSVSALVISIHIKRSTLWMTS